MPYRESVATLIHNFEDAVTRVVDGNTAWIDEESAGGEVLLRNLGAKKSPVEFRTTAVEAVAGEADYAESAAFRRIFKRATGISPHEYRKRFRWISPAAPSERPAGLARQAAVGP